MSLALRKPKTQETPNPETSEWDFPAINDEERPETLDCSVVAMCGANRNTFQLSGQNVDTARKLLAQILNIEPGATALVNGQEVEGSHVLQRNDQLEFVKKAGEKGLTARSV